LLNYIYRIVPLFLLFMIGTGKIKGQKIETRFLRHIIELSNADPVQAGQICDSLLKSEKVSAAQIGIIERIKGKSLYFSGKYEDAGKYFVSSIKNLETGQQYQELGLTLIEQAKLFRKLKMFTQAIEIYSKAYQIFKSLNDKNNLGTVLNEWGVVYEMMENYDKAIEYYHSSLKIKLELNDSVGIAYSNGFLSYVYLLKNEFQPAEEYGLESFQRFQQLNNPVNKALQSSDLALVYEKMGNFSKAIEYLQYSDSIAEVMNYPDLRSGNYERLANIYAANRQFEKAYIYLLKFKSVRDSLFTASSQKAIAELNVQYKTSEKDRNLLIQKNKLEKQDFLLIIVLLILVLVIGLVAYILRNKRLKEKQLKLDAAHQKQILQMEAQNSIQQDRLRISRDLHDNIGSYLTYIKSTIDDLQPSSEFPRDQLPLLKDLVSDTISELRRTVWLINKPSIPLEEWVIHLKEHFKNFPQVGIKSENINPDISFSALKATGIFRIVQEAVNNALKYAHCNKIDVNIKGNTTGLALSIRDNGRGFDPGTVARGFGLNNMQQRANEIYGQLKIDSTPGKGTDITLSIPV